MFEQRGSTRPTREWVFAQLTQPVLGSQWEASPRLLRGGHSLGCSFYMNQCPQAEEAGGSHV